MDLLGPIIVVGIVLALMVPIYKGLMKGLGGSKKNTKKVPLVEIKVKGVSTPSPLPDVDLSNDWLRVESIGFFGSGCRSPNGEYMVGCQDFDYQGGTFAGHRNKGYGRVVLIAGNKIVWQLDLERPNNAVVANNGTVAVNDWKFGDGLQGTFYLIDLHGNKFGYHTKANLDKCGLSQNGSLAWCTTLSTEYEPDDCRTFIFSTSPPALVLKLEGNFAPEDIYLLNNEIQLKKRGTIERYDFSSNLLNPDEVQKAFQEYTLEQGSPWELVELAKSLLYGQEKGNISESETKEISNILDKVINMAAIDDHYRAWAFRLHGELAEAQDDFKTAINHYRSALSYNPKVGVIRALSRLEKRVGK